MKCVKCNQTIPDGSVYCNHCGKKQNREENKKARKTRGNGTGTVYKRSGGWQAEVTLGYRIGENGKLQRIKRTKAGFPTKKAALEYIPTLFNKKTAPKTETIANLYQGWSSSAMEKLSGSKQTAYRIAYSKLNDVVLYSDIAALTIDDLQRNIDEKASTYYPARDMKTLLSHLYKRAVAQQNVTTNLANYIVLPDLEEVKQEAFNETEITALWKDYAAGHTFTGYILLMIYTGMMPGELLAAKKDMIDWGKQCIVGCGLKTKKRKETPIVLSDFILPVLHDLCRQSASEKLLPMHEDNFRKQFDETLARCGCRPLKPYNCRHTTATALAMGNIAPSIIKEVMRHTKFSTTQRYIHVDTARTLEAVNHLKK